MNDARIDEAVAVWMDPACCVPFIKGRVALYAILKALGCGEGDEVVLPGFTCVVVAAAVCYTGARPVFYDIDPATLQGDPAAAVRRLNERTRAVIVQHNFGAIAPAGALLQNCADRGVKVIEDCAHAMGASRPDAPVGTLGDAAFCSLQWSKPTTTGLGGIARANDPVLGDALRRLHRTEFAEPARATEVYLGILSSLYRSWYRPSWYWTAQGIYRWAGSRGLIQGSSSSEELVSGDMPEDYQTRFGRLRRKSLASALRGLPTILQHRRAVHATYHDLLADRSTWRPPAEVNGAIGAALRYPVLVENRDEVLAAARRERIEIGDWFNAPLHPRGCRPTAFGYADGSCPRAELAANRIINLPTHRHVDERVIDRTVAFLDEYARLSRPSGIGGTAP